MVTNGVWEPLDKMDLPEGSKVITSTWACKKKSNGTYYGKPEARNEVVVYPQVSLSFKPEDAEARNVVTLNASESKVKS